MRALSWALPILLVACGSEVDSGPNGSGGPGSGSLDMGAEPVDLGTELEDMGGPVDSGVIDMGFEPMPLPTLDASEASSERVEIDWLVTSATTDPWGLDWLRGTMPMPALGTDERGAVWGPARLEEDGSVRLSANRRVYLAAELALEESTTYAVSLDGFELSVDGIPLSSDPYRTGRHRQPVVLEPGNHLLIARGDSSRGNPRIRIWAVDTPVFHNLQDRIEPQLVRGRQDPQPLGFHVLNMGSEPLVGWTAWVHENESVEASARVSPPLPAGASTQVAFEVIPKAELPLGGTATITVSFEGPGAELGYSAELYLRVVEDDVVYRRTFISAMDGSAQYYGVRPPVDEAAQPTFGMALSLHGAAVQADGQARAYGPKEDMYIIAPTNRRPFGFDWQDWGRLDALEVLEDAKLSFSIDPTNVHITGHSMGGHGTWHVGVLHPDLFAVTAPSAGWPSYQSYGGLSPLPSTWERARAHSDTLVYKENLADKPVYIIHGENDNNVPAQLGLLMFDELQDVTEDLYIHIEPGRGHWWDGYPEPGAACVDWPAAIDLMRNRRRAEVALEFSYVTPSPWVSDRFSFVQLLAAEDPNADLRVRSGLIEGTLVVATENVRALSIDEDALASVGIDEVEVDGVLIPVDGGRTEQGQTVKRPGVHGPFKEVLFRPHCYIYPDGPEGAPFKGMAAYLIGQWSIIGNGKACALPFSMRDAAGDMNRIYLGVPSAQLDIPAGIPFNFDRDGVTIGGSSTDSTLLGFIFPEEDRLAGVLFATEGEHWLIQFLGFFNGRTSFPDWFTLQFGDDQVGYGRDGFFDADFEYDPSLER
ncbi:MAG: prolyl oligopeptidase family serine peptidase [Myxococcota bacterium]